jgi:preprotein translocase subunit SecA
MIDELNEKFKDYEALHLNYEDLSAVTYQSIEEDLNNRIDASLDKLQGANSEQDFNSFAQRVLLFELDSCWQEHMINLDSLKQGVGLNAYGNKNPVEEFKMESFNLFEEMMDCVRSEVLDVYLKMASKPLKPEKKKSSFTIVRIDKPDVTDGKNDVVACEETEE